MASTMVTLASKHLSCIVSLIERSVVTKNIDERVASFLSQVCEDGKDRQNKAFNNSSRLVLVESNSRC